MTKLVGIVRECDPGCGGGIFYITIPDNMDLEQQAADWREWYKNIYKPSENVLYISFADWLINNGAIGAGDEDIILFDEP